MPICATWEVIWEPKKKPCPRLLEADFLRPEILNIADGLLFVILPNKCQDGGPVSLGQLKYTENRKNIQIIFQKFINNKNLTKLYFQESTGI